MEAEVLPSGEKRVCNEGSCGYFEARRSRGEEQVMEIIGSPVTRTEVLVGCSVEKIEN